MCDQSLWVWYAFFGLPGGNNDLNVLDRNPLVRKLVEGNANSLGFWVNENWYEKYYLLADGIYPKWSCFVQSLQDPEDQKESNFSGAQESARKDVERCFGMMQARWSIITQPCRLWNSCLSPSISINSSSRVPLRRKSTYKNLLMART